MGGAPQLSVYLKASSSTISIPDGSDVTGGKYIVLDYCSMTGSATTTGTQTLQVSSGVGVRIDLRNSISFNAGSGFIQVQIPAGGLVLVEDDGTPCTTVQVAASGPNTVNRIVVAWHYRKFNG